MKHIWLILGLILVSCATYEPIKQDRQFRLIVRVNVVNDIGYGPDVMGLAVKSKNGGEIWVKGTQTKDGIIVDHKVLGHELCHLLNWQNPEFKNPDDY